MGRVIDIYGGRDPSETPMYSATAVAHHLGVPTSTVRAWARGQGAFRQVFRPAQATPLRLSFLNLVEVYVLEALRRGPARDGRGLKMPQVRQALQKLKMLKGDQTHPLARNQFSHDAVGLYVEHLGKLVSLADSQVVIREVIEKYLKRIQYDQRGTAISLEPARIGRDDDDARHIVITPSLAFGRPVVRGTGVPTAELASRNKAGDSAQSLALEFGLPVSEVSAALRWELGEAAAA